MIKAEEGYREFELDNGLKVMLQETPTQTIYGRLRVNFGALNENPGEEGLAHFLEHNLIMGGSQKYSPEESDRIRSRFGYYNAYTNLGETTFPVDMITEDLEAYLSFISDTAFNPLIDERNFEQERQRVLREIADHRGKPDFEANRAHNVAFFGEDSPYIYEVLGKEEVVNSVTQEELRNFYHRGYGASNMDLILVGGLPENVEDLIRENFEDQRKGNYVRFNFPKNPFLEDSVSIHTGAVDLLNRGNPSESNSELSISLVSPSIDEEDSYATKILTRILGEGIDSRIFKRVSQEMGLAYSIGARIFYREKMGMISIHGNVKSVSSQEAIDAIFDEMEKLRKDGISEEELENKKRAIKYRVAKELEQNGGKLQHIETEHDYGLNLESYLSTIDRVSTDEVLEAARKYLPENREDGEYVLLLRDPLKQ